MRLKAVLAATLIATAAMFAPAVVHAPGKGHNGGLRVDAGQYHTELLVDGSKTVRVFLSDVDDRPIPAAGFKATAILVIGGKRERIELTPAEASLLVGQASSPVKPGVKGVVQLTDPAGTMSQGKY